MLKHIFLGILLILIGIGIIRFMIKNPDFFGVLSYHRFGSYLFGGCLIFIGILEFFGCINWHW